MKINNNTPYSDAPEGSWETTIDHFESALSTSEAIRGIGNNSDLSDFREAPSAFTPRRTSPQPLESFNLPASFTAENIIGVFNALTQAIYAPTEEDEQFILRSHAILEELQNSLNVIVKAKEEQEKFNQTLQDTYNALIENADCDVEIIRTSTENIILNITALMNEHAQEVELFKTRAQKRQTAKEQEEQKIPTQGQKRTWEKEEEESSTSPSSKLRRTSPTAAEPQIIFRTYGT